jgi:hypothetical protein
MGSFVLAAFYVPGGRLIMSSNEGADKMQKLLDLRRVSIEDMTPPIREFGDFLVRFHIPYQYSSLGSPAKWPPLSPKYKRYKERVRPGAPLLVFNGTMKAGFGYDVRGRGDLFIRNTQEYARYHQTGTRKMPARKWLQLTEDDYTVLRRYTQKYMMGYFGIEK